MHSRRKIRRSLGLLPKWAAVLGLAIGLTVCLYRLSEQWSAQYWRQQLAAAKDDELPQIVQRLAGRGADGIGALVDGLASPKENVQREVRLALDEEVNRWMRLPNQEASRRISWLTSALASQAETIQASSKPFAADLATRLLLWPTDGAVVDRTRIVAECELVLRATHSRGDESADALWRRQQDAALAARASADRWTSALPVATHEKLPPESLQAPALPPLATAPWATESTETPRTLRPDTATKRIHPASGVKRPATRNPLRATANQAAQTEDATADHADWSQPLDESERAESVETASAVSESNRFSRTQSLDLFAELSSTSGAAAAAEAELTRRGSTHRQIEVGKHLTSTDAEERRRWAEALPGLRGIDTKQWLLILSRDESAEVRRAAIILMATSQDPEMLARVEEVARDDPEPALRQQAARTIAEQK
jgi:hypothetical protein